MSILHPKNRSSYGRRRNRQPALPKILIDRERRNFYFLRARDPAFPIADCCFRLSLRPLPRFYQYSAVIALSPPLYPSSVVRPPASPDFCFSRLPTFPLSPGKKRVC